MKDLFLKCHENFLSSNEFKKTRKAFIASLKQSSRPMKNFNDFIAVLKKESEKSETDAREGTPTASNRRVKRKSHFYL